MVVLLLFRSVCLWFTLGCLALPQAFTHEDLRRNDPDYAYLNTLNQAFKKLWPFNSPQWVQCLRDFAAQRKAERKEKQTAAPALETTACVSPGVSHAASAASPQTPEAAAQAPETQAQAAETDASDAAPVTAIPKASRVLKDRLVVGDIVVLDNSVAKDFRGQEAEVLRVFAKNVKLTMLHGKGKGKHKNFDPKVCKVVRPSTFRLGPVRQASSEALSAADAPATPQPTPASAAEAPTTPNETTIIDDEMFTE